jgi:hypothetical protein
MYPLSRWGLTRAFVVGGLLLAVGAYALATRRSEPMRYRLVLNVDRDERCIYESAWNDGDPIVPTDASDGAEIKMTRDYSWEDGCIWRATETLRAVAADKYVYEYEEHPIYCMCHAKPAPACPLVGTVTVVPLD